MSNVESDDNRRILDHVGRFSSTEMARFLSVVTMELTIVGRETYVPGSMQVADPVKLRAVNECQHFLLGILRRLLFAENVDTDSLVETLVSLSRDQYVGEGLQASLQRGVRQTKPFPG